MRAAPAWTSILLIALSAACHADEGVQTVHFMSRDGKTTLTGYLFMPAGAGPHPAVVMLHGRGGPYSVLKRGTYDATSLTQRHRMWARFWAARGYVALHVDSFGPRGYLDGFPKHSYDERPAAVSERFVRPLDAYGALDYLRTRRDVIPDRVGVQGWSNGGMTVLATMDSKAPGTNKPTPISGFRAALAFYPSCRTQLRADDYTPYAPILILSGSDDDEVSPRVCGEFSRAARARGAPIEFVLYEGAHHAYDDPGRRKQSYAPNRYALEDSLYRAEMFFRAHLQP